AHPAHAAGLADAHQFVIGVADLADGGAAVGRNEAHFTGGKAQRGGPALAGEKHRAVAGGTHHLGAAARLELDAVNHRTDGNLGQGKAVADAEFRFGTAHHLGADFKALGGDDVGFGSVDVVEEGDVGR